MTLHKCLKKEFITGEKTNLSYSVFSYSILFSKCKLQKSGFVILPDYPAGYPAYPAGFGRHPTSGIRHPARNTRSGPTLVPNRKTVR